MSLYKIGDTVRVICGEIYSSLYVVQSVNKDGTCFLSSLDGFYDVPSQDPNKMLFDNRSRPTVPESRKFTFTPNTEPMFMSRRDTMVLGILTASVSKDGFRRSDDLSILVEYADKLISALDKSRGGK